MTAFVVRDVVPGRVWDEIVLSDRGLVFASAGYLRLIGDHLNGAKAVHLGAYRGERLVGVMPAFEATVPGVGRVANSSPFFGSHGGVYCADVGRGRSEIVQALLEAWSTNCSQRGSVLGTVIEPLGTVDSEVYRKTLLPWRTDGRIGQIVEQLPADESELFRCYHQKTRNAIRKALKEGIKIRESRDPDDFRFLYQVHRENMQLLGGRPKRSSFFEALTRHLSPAAWRLLIAEASGERIAALLLLAFGDCVEYFTPVIRAEHRQTQPMSLLTHRAMVGAAAEGYRRFNFGGTWRTQEGVYRFKQRFGAIDLPYTYYVQLYRPNVALPSDFHAVVEQAKGFYLYPPFQT